ncbi:MAG: DUF1415 domain-containing protein [Burkholderiaceae bacterium]
MNAANVIAATQRWLEAVVIGLNLCPFAKAVQVKRQIRYSVTEVTDARALLDVLGDEMSLLVQADPGAIDTTLLIHPHALTDFVEYAAFLHQANRALRKAGFEGVLQIASFHPDYVFADGAPGDIENFSNRSPYPMLHLLREDSVARAVEAFPDAADIYERNIGTLRRLGHDGLRRLLTEACIDHRAEDSAPIIRQMRDAGLHGNP